MKVLLIFTAICTVLILSVGYEMSRNVKKAFTKEQWEEIGKKTKSELAWYITAMFYFCPFINFLFCLYIGFNKGTIQDKIIKDYKRVLDDGIV